VETPSARYLPTDLGVFFINDMMMPIKAIPKIMPATIPKGTARSLTINPAPAIILLVKSTGSVKIEDVGIIF
jgi:hypothetical protein